MSNKYAPIYEALAGLGSPYVLPADWSWLPVDASCRVLGDPVAAWTRLTQQFPAAELLASGVARQVDGNLVLNPVLAAEDPGLIVLRKADGVAFDIVTAAGCVSGAPPIFKVHHDRVAKRGIAASPRRGVFVTFSMLDMVLLRSLGVAVAPAAHLQSLRLRQLWRLLALVGGTAEGDIPQQAIELPTDEPEDRRTSGSTRPDHPAEFTLAIVAATISARTANAPVALPAVARYLSRAERNLGFLWRGIQVWYPTPRDLETLRFRWHLRSAGALRSFFVTHPGTFPLKDFQRLNPSPTKGPTPAKKYFELLANLQTKPIDPLDIPAILRNPQAAQQTYDAFIERQFLMPMVEKAMETANPEERARLMQISTLLRLHHGITPAILDMLRRSTEDIRNNGGQFLPTDTFRQFDHLHARLQKLYQLQKPSPRSRPRR